MAGNMTTAFIPQEFPEGFKGYPFTDAHYQQVALMALSAHFKYFSNIGTTSFPLLE